MQVTLDLPDDISQALQGEWHDLHGRALEALAVEGYRTGALTERQGQGLLELDARLQVHALLKDHHVALRFTESDLEDDRRLIARSPFLAGNDRRRGQQPVRRREVIDALRRATVGPSTLSRLETDRFEKTTREGRVNYGSQRHTNHLTHPMESGPTKNQHQTVKPTQPSLSDQTVAVYS